MTATNEVLFQSVGRLGQITLNRPMALNALSIAMVDAIADRLDAWEADAAIGAVLLHGAGERGLCAGGDIRAVYTALASGRPEDAIDFMAREYRLNARIGAYPKPYVAFMDGIVMGGGIGLSAHGSIRLVTARTIVAMPETTLGMFPDVGGTFLLSRAPGELGTHAALTARRFGAADAILLGLADGVVPENGLARLIADLSACQSAQAVADATTALRVTPSAGTLARQRDWIDRCYRHDDVEAILDHLDRDANPEAREAAQEIRRNSPTALKVTLRALREARDTPDLDTCLEREFGMVTTALLGHEFREGIRAAVIDKDSAPRWRPAALQHVDAATVDAYFAPRPRKLDIAH